MHLVSNWSEIYSIYEKCNDECDTREVVSKTFEFITDGLKSSYNNVTNFTKVVIYIAQTGTVWLERRIVKSIDVTLN
jgi:hypothetical protein